MSRKLLTLISLILIGTFMFTACAPTEEAPEAPEVGEVEEPEEPEEVKEVEEPEEAEEPVTITWWHITTADEQRAVWDKLANEYMAAHENVNIEITVMENENFKTKLTTVMQAGEPPHIFQSWGGGTMIEYAKAGLLQDITADLDAEGGAW